MDYRPQVVVRTLADLETAALHRRSVTWRRDCVTPAAVVLNMPGSVIARMIRNGLYVYFPKSKKGEMPF